MCMTRIYFYLRIDFIDMVGELMPQVLHAHNPKMVAYQECFNCSQAPLVSTDCIYAIWKIVLNVNFLWRKKLWNQFLWRQRHRNSVRFSGIARCFFCILMIPISHPKFLPIFFFCLLEVHSDNCACTKWNIPTLWEQSNSQNLLHLSSSIGRYHS